MADSTQPGRYIEADLDHLDDGQFRDQFEKALREAYRQFREYEAAARKAGKVALNVKLTLSRVGDQFINIEYTTDVKAPSVPKNTSLIGSDKRLLINPEGDDLNDKRQMVLPTFDSHGRPRASINVETGEVAEPAENEGDVVGQVGGDNAS